uniref:Putative reverse transcriptase, intron maturase and HNH endonuclease n=1 Tax=Chaetophora lobata TaxID=1249516 RepID=A0A7U1AQ00_9CHLO|nr:putative reverse transcriptase, intron maturase and HNH endonuclease [Chaetophora lobata]
MFPPILTFLEFIYFMKLSIIIPDLNPPDFKLFSIYIDKFLSIGILIKNFFIIQRAQMALSLQIDKKEIQQLDSMRFSAQAIQNNIYIKDLHTSQSVINTSFYNINEFKDIKDEEGRAKFINQQIDEVQLAPRNKLLNPNQINAETLPIHRKGLVAKYIGITQSIPIYAPKDIIKQVNPLYIEFPNIYECSSNICSLCGLDLNSDIFTLYKDIFKVDSTFPATETAKIIIDTLIFKDNDNNKTIFTDGIGVGTEENLLPVEKDFSIQRTLPSAPLEIPVINPQDELLLWMQNKALTSNSKLSKAKKNKTTINPPSSRKTNTSKRTQKKEENK